VNRPLRLFRNDFIYPNEVRIPIEKDGNCLYRCFAYLETGDENNYNFYRHLCASYIQNFIEASLVASETNNELQILLEIARREGAYGETEHLTILSTILVY
jgi:hypothetical protein